MAQKRSTNPQTTAQQRKLLFKTWEATGNITLACRTANVGRVVFYYWKPRFEAKGYAGLEESNSRAPHRPHRVDGDVARQVIELRRKNPGLGKHQIAKELARANQFRPVISPNTVRRILIDAGLWEKPPPGKEAKPQEPDP